MIKKRYLKTKPECKVYFKLPKKETGNADKVSLVGDFNDWDPEANPMKKLSNGDFSLTINLTKDQDYQFKYYVDGSEWINDEDADKLAPTPFPDTKNSVLSI